MDAHSQIDFFLRFFYKIKDDKRAIPYEEIKINKKLLEVSGNDSELERIILKLRDDKYLQMWGDYPLKEDGTKDTGKQFVSNLSITFDGRLFIEQGGYTQAKINVDQNEKRIIRNESRLVYATFFAGLAGFSLVFWEMYKTFCLNK
jgi:hypothetical protein